MPLHDDTCSPGLTSWVVSAQSPGTDFPIQNLPCGVFQHGDAAPHVGVAIGDQVLDLHAAAAAGVLTTLPLGAEEACGAATLNPLLAMGRPVWRALRQRVSQLLRADHAELRDDAKLRARLLIPQDAVVMRLPAAVGDYTDFYASMDHATNVGRMFRPNQPLLPNYKWVPIGYHGRASSLVVTGNDVRRPVGQIASKEGTPRFEPTRQLDYELEVGFVVGPGNALGDSVPLLEAEEHLFGICLLNDWSARDIQSWEYQPLGPFLAKSFATSLSPWVVTLEALEPFRVPAAPRAEDDPRPLPYLSGQANAAHGGMDVQLEVWIESRTMREMDLSPARLCRSMLRALYWTPAQMVAHHTSNGCNLRPGDLLGSGTVSGPGAEARGCMLELTERGHTPFVLPTGETRGFLEDGDEVTLRGWCERPGFARIGLGECRGRVVGAHQP